MAYRTVLSVFSALLFLIGLVSPLDSIAADPEPPKSLQSICNEALTSAEMPIEWVAAAQAGHRATQSPAEIQFASAVQLMGSRTAAINTELARFYAHTPFKYNHVLMRTSETNQAQSGRCWAFAGLNVIRRFPVAAGNLPDKFEFSQAYIYWWHIFEQANDYLELVIRARGTRMSPRGRRSLMSPSAHIHQGGWYERFAYLVDKYGLVPKQVMPDHWDMFAGQSTMLQVMNERLAIAALRMTELGAVQRGRPGPRNRARTQAEARELREIKLQTMEEVRRILSTSLGAPPTRFEWSWTTDPMRSKEVPRDDLRYSADTLSFEGTPIDFYNATVRRDGKGGLDVLKDFAVVSASPLLEPGRLYATKKDPFAHDSTAGTAYDQKMLNLSIEDLSALTDNSISYGIPVWFAADVGRDVHAGIRVMDPNLFNYDAVFQLPSVQWADSELRRRALTFTRVVSPNHAMVIDRAFIPAEAEPATMYGVENSWGTPYLDNKPDPWHMTAEWYRRNVYQIVVHKDVLGPELWETYKNGTPTVIKKEGWMFATSAEQDEQQ